MEVVIAGKEKKDRILTEHEKKVVSYHETGHALVTALLKNSEPVQKITIVPRTMGSLGYVLQVPEEEKHLKTKEEMIDQIRIFMAGRAAEQVVFNSVTTGASNDMEKATNIARNMVMIYGMSEKFGMVTLASVENPYLDGSARRLCSEETATQVDEEVKNLLNQCYEEAEQLIRENRAELDELAKFLYEHETITGKQFMEIFNRMKGIEVPEETKETEESESAKETKASESDEESKETESAKESKGE